MNEKPPSLTTIQDNSHSNHHRGMNMAFLKRPPRPKKPTATRNNNSIVVSQSVTQKHYLSSSSEHQSESTIAIEDEWYMSDHGSDPPSPRAVPDEVVTLLQGSFECQSSDGTMTRVLQGSVVTLPSTPPPPRVCRVVSGDSSSFESQDDSVLQDWNSPYCTKSDASSYLPPQLNLATWSAVNPVDYPVRSENYLQSRRKQAWKDAAMSLWAVDLVQTDKPLSMCEHPNERFQTCLRQGTAPAFCFAVNICLPAPKGGAKVSGAFYQFVAYFGVNDKSRLFDQGTPVGRLVSRFCHGEESDTFRNETFKLIPKIVNGGGFVFRQAVGSKPVLLGQKVSQKYYRTQDYCEVLVDIASDPIAKRIVRMALGLAVHLTVDLSFCLEGKTVETLPEKLLGGFRVQGLNFADDGQRFVESDSYATSL